MHMQTTLTNNSMKKSALRVCAMAGGLLVFHAGLCVAVAHPRVTPPQAVKGGDLEMVKALLDEGADPNQKDENGTPLLMHAVLYGDAAMVKLLLKRGASPDLTNGAGATALIWAAGDPEKATLLMDAGAAINIRSALGRTPLLVAAATDGAGALVRDLLAMGANASVRDHLKGNPKLMTGGGRAPAIVEAAKARDGEALSALLAQRKSEPGFDLNATDGNGGTALTEAVVLGHHNNVRRLLDEGASVDVHATLEGYSPLILAAMRGDEWSVAALIEAGADVNQADAGGTTPLMWAAYAAEAGPTTVVDLLLRAGADPTPKNRRGETASSMAAWHGKTPTVERLQKLLQPQPKGDRQAVSAGAGAH
jgi:ankyrin repeat protein